jgi:cyanophycinase
MINAKRLLYFCFWIVAGNALALAQPSVADRFQQWPVDLSIKGRVLVTDSPDGLVAWLRKPNSNRRQVGTPPSPRWIVFGTEDLVTSVKQAVASFDLSIETRPGFEDPFESPADVWVWCDQRQPLQIPEEEIQSARRTLRRKVDSGGTVCLVGPIAAIAGKFLATPNSSQSISMSGLNLIPDGLLLIPSDEIPGTDPTRGADASAGTHPLAITEQGQSILSAEAKAVVVALSRETAMVLDGRKVVVHGPGYAKLHLAAGDHLPARSHAIRDRSTSESAGAESWMADWTQWRREAIDRTLERFPPPDRITPRVENGTLVIVGGGGMPDGLMARFVEIAGGTEAKLVYVPCLEEEDATREAGMLAVWKAMGVQQCSMLHTKNRIQANEDSAFLEPLKSATGIWFGGGRQWNLADSYYGTKAHQLMLEVLNRGGIVGGSSAGASIQGNYLARATPIENFRIMAPGYERGGLGFIHGVAIDQHFSQRGRQKDLRSLVQTYPQMLGIGIDEATAIIVRKSTAEIVGKGRVFFYSSSSPYSPSDPKVDEQAGNASQVFDLENWRFAPS